MARARGYIGGDAPEFIVGNDQMRTIVDEDSGVVTHVSARAFGCDLPCDREPILVGAAALT